MSTSVNKLSTSDEEAHQAYMKKMTEPHNIFNVFLNAYWAPWAKSCMFDGNRELSKPATSSMWTRMTTIPHFSYAVPSQLALDTIARYGPIIEIGCGTGYWAHLLDKQGVDVIAVDSDPNEKKFFPRQIAAEGCQYLRENDGCADRTLFMSWPLRESQVEEMLKAYRGDVLILIGEEDGGCTWAMPYNNKEWKHIEQLEIPTWHEVHDSLNVYARVHK